MTAKGDYAKRILGGSFENIYNALGLSWTADNQAEIDAAVDDLVKDPKPLNGKNVSEAYNLRHLVAVLNEARESVDDVSRIEQFYFNERVMRIIQNLNNCIHDAVELVNSYSPGSH